jgi:hypothetical protein
MSKDLNENARGTTCAKGMGIIRNMADTSIDQICESTSKVNGQCVMLKTQLMVAVSKMHSTNGIG